MKERVEKLLELNKAFNHQGSFEPAEEVMQLIKDLWKENQAIANRTLFMVDTSTGVIRIEECTKCEALKARERKLEEALKFYQHKWVNVNGEDKPAARLLADKGQIAKAALESIKGE